jgi:diadenosine tetraphosphate (Ap4A) HIT family hydrolase
MPVPEAFNLGVNDSKVAGQTMLQFHFHVIPRYSGDVANPHGGVCGHSREGKVLVMPRIVGGRRNNHEFLANQPKRCSRCHASAS